MKRVWAALALILTVVLLAGYSTYTVNKSLKRLQALCEELTEQSDKREQAIGLAGNLTKEWQKSQKIFSVWISHENLEQINSQIALLSYFADRGDGDQLRRSLQVCMAYFESLRQSQRFSVQNIF